ncbi:hypothetical protein AB0M29_26420 [Streptomyces sp. NPDC051976]|uniref:hypothetical protein n=1 Tax=Streptomyces sp. NPDC051976 TaxID=3154947 RepID=UPI0034275E42
MPRSFHVIAPADSRPPEPAADAWGRMAGRRAAWSAWGPYVLVAALFWLILTVAARHTPINGDFGQHASAVERVKADWLHPANPLLRESGTGSPYYSPYIVTLGLLARATGAAGWKVLRWCGPVNLAVLVVGVGAYAHTLSRRRLAPVYALLAFTLLWGVNGSAWSGFCGVRSLTLVASYPSTFAVGLSFVLWTLADRLARRPATVAAYAGLGVLAGILLLIHPITALAAGVGVAAVVAGRQRGWTRRVAARWAVTVGAALVVAAVWPYYDVFRLAGDSTVDAVHKELYAHLWGWYGLALVGLPALVRRGRTCRRDPLVLMFGADLLIVTYGWFSGHYTYGRVFALLLVPLQFALAVELAEIPPWTLLRRVLAPLAAVALGLGLLAQAGAVMPRHVLVRTLERPRPWPGYQWAAHRIPVGAVVLTSGYLPIHVLPAYGAFLVAPAWPDPSTSLADRDRRFADTRAYLAPHATPALQRAIQQRYDVSWLLLTRGQRVPFDGTVIAAKPATGERLVRLAAPG